jgi:hypothetical protein
MTTPAPPFYTQLHVDGISSGFNATARQTIPRPLAAHALSYDMRFRNLSRHLFTMGMRMLGLDGSIRP